MIPEPRDNSSSNLSELGLFDFWILVDVVLVVVVVVVVDVVVVVVDLVLMLTRIIKSVVTGQAPVTLELRNTPGKTQTAQGGTRMHHS